MDFSRILTLTRQLFSFTHYLHRDREPYFAVMKHPPTEFAPNIERIIFAAGPLWATKGASSASKNGCMDVLSPLQPVRSGVFYRNLPYPWPIDFWVPAHRARYGKIDYRGQTLPSAVKVMIFFCFTSKPKVDTSAMSCSPSLASTEAPINSA